MIDSWRKLKTFFIKGSFCRQTEGERGTDRLNCLILFLYPSCPTVKSSISPELPSGAICYLPHRSSVCVCERERGLLCVFARKPARTNKSRSIMMYLTLCVCMLLSLGVCNTGRKSNCVDSWLYMLGNG